jgi:plasmid stability protein
MSVNLSIKDVPDALAQALRERAARHHRSLQGELMAIIEEAAAQVAGTAPDGTAPSISAPRESPASLRSGWKSIEQLIAEREARGWKPDPQMMRLPRGVDLVRSDRDRR